MNMMAVNRHLPKTLRYRAGPAHEGTSYGIIGFVEGFVCDFHRF